MDHIVFFSGGLSSYFTALEVAKREGTGNLKLLFTDTSYEDPDLYRFLKEAAADVGGELVWLKDGRTPWDVFRDVRFLGNTRLDPCSRVLKREPAQRWVKENYPDSLNVTLYIGMSYDEKGRWERSVRYWSPYSVESPLLEFPGLDRFAMLSKCKARGIEPPVLYDLGFPHNNCGGFCVKAGHRQWDLLRVELPEKFAEEEANEKEFREWIGKDVSILRDRRGGGQMLPMTLELFRQRMEADRQPLLDWGGCGCFSDIPEEEIGIRINLDPTINRQSKLTP